MDAIAEIPQPVANAGGDKFIPVRKEDILSTLVEQGAFANTDECELFRRFARTFRTICHYEYSETLDRLRDDYYYFSPEIAGLATTDRAKRDCTYEDLVQSLDKVLKDANFEELPHEDVTAAHRKRTVPVEVRAEHDDFREVRFYRRGRHVEQVEVSKWFGLQRRKAEIEVFDDVVLLIAIKAQAEIGSRRELRILKRRKIVPGSVLLKYFRNIACGDLYALFPNARVVMSNFDKAFLGVPALAGGIPILIKLYATISVLFLVTGIYLGGSGSVADNDMKTALAALMGLVALGGFAMRQWLKYQHQSLKYHMELSENIYYRNLNNNAGIFDHLIGTAEDQEAKEALLAYHFIRKAQPAPTVGETATRIETWLAKNFDVNVDFDIAHAVAALDRYGLVQRDGERLFVPPLEAAIAQLHEVWNNFFRREQSIEPQ
ncbi:MAG TPA: TMEM143 family protein [Xanthobacteraceae bacterium]|nr:TMEM143 family protein [Xanthobacteraceae bacterium]